jgi:hypothetical protein
MWRYSNQPPHGPGGNLSGLKSCIPGFVGWEVSGTVGHHLKIWPAYSVEIYVSIYAYKSIYIDE